MPFRCRRWKTWHVTGRNTTTELLERGGGTEIVHRDVMDGHFVPNITFGPPVVKALRPVTKLPLDCHLMIENPDAFIADFAEAGADMICVCTRRSAGICTGRCS